MTTRSGPGGFVGALGADARALAGKVRRYAITLTTKALWQLTGHLLPDGTIETRDGEAFTGIGFYARPPASGNPEAIAVFLGAGTGAGNPVIVALRDEATRAAVAGGIQVGETVIYTDKAIVLIKADGSIEARSAAGVASKLPTRADLLALSTALAGAANYAAFQTAVAGLVTGGWPLGTLKFKAE